MIFFVPHAFTNERSGWSLSRDEVGCARISLSVMQRVPRGDLVGTGPVCLLVSPARGGEVHVANVGSIGRWE